jgi:hypothetical protein
MVLPSPPDPKMEWSFAQNSRREPNRSISRIAEQAATSSNENSPSTVLHRALPEFIVPIHKSNILDEERRRSEKLGRNARPTRDNLNRRRSESERYFRVFCSDLCAVIYSAWERCAGPPYFGKLHCRTTAYFVVLQLFIIN